MERRSIPWPQAAMLAAHGSRFELVTAIQQGRGEIGSFPNGTTVVMDKKDRMKCDCAVTGPERGAVNDVCLAFGRRNLQEIFTPKKN